MSLCFKPISEQEQQDSPYDEVEWLDTDASEDEDYFPQFPIQQQQQAPILPSIKDYFLKQANSHYNHQISGSSFDSNTSLDTEEEEEEDEEDFFDSVLLENNSNSRMNLTARTSTTTTTNKDDVFLKKLNISSESPADKVRQAIDKTIDNGIERVDISHVGLTEIPDEIKELQYVTVVHNDVVKTAALQIFLYGNDLQCINPLLFHLKSLTVLSLRNNRLTTIPSDIALLENLVELSLGNNQLQTIPGELLRLDKLTTLSLFPNPFLPLPSDQCHRKRIQQRRSSLTEISTRQILATNTSEDMIKRNHTILPIDIIQRFQSISKVNYCELCKLSFHVPDIEEIIWRTVLGNHHVPTVFRFCSVRCCNKFSIKDQQVPITTTTTPTEEENTA